MRSQTLGWLGRARLRNGTDEVDCECALGLGEFAIANAERNGRERIRSAYLEGTSECRIRRFIDLSEVVVRYSLKAAMWLSDRFRSPSPFGSEGRWAQFRVVKQPLASEARAKCVRFRLIGSLLPSFRWDRGVCQAVVDPLIRLVSRVVVSCYDSPLSWGTAEVVRYGPVT